jgi:N-acetylglucosamine kinase-like BadF-type ATPase
MALKSTTYLGIDGGGSRCRARIEDGNGRLLGEGTSGPATTRIGVEMAWRSIMEASEAAAVQAGLKHEDFSRLHAGIGLAGLGRRGAEAALKKIAHPFASEVLSAFDDDPYQAVAWSEEARATDYAAFAPLVLRHANQGDPIGRRIVERAADAIGDLLDFFLARGIDRLSLVGGLSGAIATWLTPDLRNRLKQPDADAVAGALLIARRRFVLPEGKTDRERVPKFRV